MSDTMSRRRVAVVLGALAALAPLSIDAYLPALPSITRDLAGDPGSIQLTLTTFFAGITVGQLFYGPLSDRFGRKPLIYCGLGLYVLGSIGCVLATTPGQLVAARLFQGLGGSIGMVIALAVVRDLHTGLAAARMMAMIVTVLGAAPVIAPMIGSAAIAHSTWRAVFVLLTLFGLVLLVAAGALLPETRAPELRAASRPSRALRDYGRLLVSGDFIPFALCLCLAQGGFFAFIAGSAEVFITGLGMSPTGFSVFFAVAAGAIMLVGRASVPFAARFGFVGSARRLLVVYAAAGVGMVAVVAGGFDSLPVMCLLSVIFIGTLGGIIPSLNMPAMEAHGAIAGTAAALIGAFQFLGGALASGVVGSLANGTAMPMVAVVALCGVGALGLATMGLRGTEEGGAVAVESGD